MKVLLLIDWHQHDKEKWSFWRELNSYVDRCDILSVSAVPKFNWNFQKILFLWSRYFILAFKTLFKMHHYDVLIANQGSIGLFLAFFFRLYPFRKPALVIIAFIHRERSNRLTAKLRYRFTKYALKNTSRAICYSTFEKKYYTEHFKAEPGKFVFLPYGTDTEKLDLLPESSDTAEDPFIFSAGSSNRDYGTFFEAVRDVPMKVVVFAKRYNLHGLAIPGNVTVHYDVYGEIFYRYLKSASLVVVALKEENLSSGQMVMFEAMYLAKPVIITKSCGSADYVRHGEDIFWVKSHDVQDLKDAIQTLISDKTLSKKIARNAKKTIDEKYNYKIFARDVAKLLNNL